MPPLLLTLCSHLQMEVPQSFLFWRANATCILRERAIHWILGTRYYSIQLPRQEKVWLAHISSGQGLWDSGGGCWRGLEAAGSTWYKHAERIISSLLPSGLRKWLLFFFPLRNRDCCLQRGKDTAKVTDRARTEILTQFWYTQETTLLTMVPQITTLCLSIHDFKRMG